MDAGHPQVLDHLSVVRQTLDEIEAGDRQVFVVLNKIDTPAAGEALAGLMEHEPEAIAVSASTGKGMGHLMERIAETLPEYHDDRTQRG